MANVARHVLLVDGARGTEDGLLDAFALYEGELARRLGLSSERVQAASLEEVADRIGAARDIALVVLPWDLPADAATGFFAGLSPNERPPCLVFFDQTDQSTSPFLGTLPYVDRFVKRHVLVDRRLYARSWAGGTVVTDFLVRRLGFDLGDWHFGVPAPAGQGDRVVLGWEPVVGRRIRDLVQAGAGTVPWSQRDIDVHCRVGLGPGERREWYFDYRTWALERLRRLAPGWRTVVSGGTDEAFAAAGPAFTEELRRSRIVVSPFGWGEISFRDYEAVACGCLLVKPSIAHMATSPDIFAAGRGYAPVRWDLSDLDPVCEHYLTHPQEAERIARHARRRLYRYFERGGWLKDVARALNVTFPDAAE